MSRVRSPSPAPPLSSFERLAVLGGRALTAKRFQLSLGTRSILSTTIVSIGRRRGSNFSPSCSTALTADAPDGGLSGVPSTAVVTPVLASHDGNDGIASSMLKL